MMYDRYLSESLDAHYDAGAQRRKRAYLTRNYSALLPPSRTAAILDVGPGRGEFLELCLELGYSCLTAVDVSPEVCQRLSERLGGKVKVVQADVAAGLDAGLADHFEAIAMLDVLEHIPKLQLRPVLVELHRVLRPGGLAMMQTVNQANLFAPILRYSDLTHEIAFTEFSLAQLLRGSPFMRFELRPLAVPFDSWLRIPQAALRAAYFAALRFLHMVEGTLKPSILTPDIVALAWKAP
jgi:SAM-dependent methyltransferase